MEPPALLWTAAGIDSPEDRAHHAATQAGDLAAFERLLRQHERLVLATALRLLGNLEDAQDAAQEVFLRLHHNLAKVQSSGNIAGWLYRVTVNVCRDAVCPNPPLDVLHSPAINSHYSYSRLRQTCRLINSAQKR